jgi:hypothetical protein
MLELSEKEIELAIDGLYAVNMALNVESSQYRKAGGCEKQLKELAEKRHINRQLYLKLEKSIGVNHV